MLMLLPILLCAPFAVAWEIPDAPTLLDQALALAYSFAAAVGDFLQASNIWAKFNAAASSPPTPSPVAQPAKWFVDWDVGLHASPYSTALICGAGVVFTIGIMLCMFGASEKRMAAAARKDASSAVRGCMANADVQPVSSSADKKPSAVVAAANQGAAPDHRKDIKTNGGDGPERSVNVLGSCSDALASCSRVLHSGTDALESSSDEFGNTDDLQGCADSLRRCIAFLEICEGALECYSDVLDCCSDALEGRSDASGTR